MTTFAIFPPSNRTYKSYKSHRSYYIESSLINRYVFQIHLAGVFGTRADQLVVAQLFEHVRRPAGDATDGEDWRVEVYRNAEHVVGRGRVEIHVGPDRFLFPGHLLDDDLFDAMRHVEPFRVALAFADLFGHPAQMCGARVFGAIDGVPDAHDLSAGVELVMHVLVDFFERADLKQHLHNLLVGAAVQRA